MNTRLLILLLITSIVACQPHEETPTDYTSAVKQLTKKKKQLFDLKKEVEDLEILVKKFDTSKVVKNIRTVEVFELKKRDFQHFVDIQSEFKSDNTVKVSSELGGRISGLSLDDGDRINKGQYIGQVDTEQLKNQLAELNKALELAKDVYERQDRLWKQNIGSEIQYLQAKNNKERLEKSITSLNVGFEKSKIYAPISGVIEMMSVENGEVIAPGQPLFTISNTNRLKLIASVPETYIKALKRGKKVKVYIPTLDKELNARINKVGNSIHPSNRTIQVEMLISNKSGYLKPNMLAEIKLMDYEAKAVYLVPLEYIQQGFNQDKFVYTIENKEGSYYAKKQIIVPGKSYKNMIEILEGINENAQLITVGSKGLTEGEEVRIRE